MCARLIRAFETGQRYEGGVASAEHGRNVAIEQVKVREDVALADTGPEAQELFEIFRQRLQASVQRRAIRAVGRGIGGVPSTQGRDDVGDHVFGILDA